MRVLYVTHCTDMSGANRSMVQMILELRQNHGVEPFVIYPKVFGDEKGTIADVLRENHIQGFKHCLTCFQRKQTGLFHKLYFVFAGGLFLLHIMFLLRKIEFDLVHSNSSIIDMGMYIARLRRIPHIWHFREVASLSFGAKSIFGEKYQRWIYSKTDKVIAISNNVKKEFVNLIPLDKTVVIYNGIKPPKVTHFPDYDGEMVNVCIIGRVEPNKNQNEAVEAVSFLKPEVRKKIRLHIIGNNKSDYGKSLLLLIKENGLEDTVIVHGVRNDVNEMLQDMNIGLMLSKHEAFGRVTVEYMMHGVCVIASNTSANPEIIKDGENGLLYSIGNPEDLAKKISSLINNRVVLKSLSKRGYDDAMEHYQSRTNSDLIFEEYLSINHH